MSFCLSISEFELDPSLGSTLLHKRVFVPSVNVFASGEQFKKEKELCMSIESSVRLITAITLLILFLLLTFVCVASLYDPRFLLWIAVCGPFLEVLLGVLCRNSFTSVWIFHLLPRAVVPGDFDPFDPFKFFLFVHCQFAHLFFLMEFIYLFNNFIVGQLWNHVRGFQSIIHRKFVLEICY